MRPFHRLRRSIRAQRGTSTTEALVVLLFGILIAAGAVAVLAPGLTNTLIEALAPLGVDLRLDDSEGSAGAGWYVLFAILAVGFFAFLVAPMLFPKARDKREKVVSDFTGSFRIRDVFTDQDRRARHGVDELRKLSEEVKRQGTPMGGVPAARREPDEPRVAIDAAGIGASEEPTVVRDRPVTGKEAAISALPQLEPLGAGPSEEPTVGAERPKSPATSSPNTSSPNTSRRAPGRDAPHRRSDDDKGLVLRSLKGVRSADYKSPEPIIGDDEKTIDRAERPRFPVDDPDESTNIIPREKARAAAILAEAAEMPAGPNDPTQLHSELQEDLRTTLQQDAHDPAGPDATTNLRFDRDE